MKVKTNFVPDEVSYLTPGKEYEVIRISPDSKHCVEIKDDEGDIIDIRPYKCAHLDGKQ